MESAGTPNLHQKLEELNQRLRKMSYRTQTLAGEICGRVPSDASNELKPIETSVHDKADRAHQLLCSIEDSLTRMENAIGMPAKTIPEQPAQSRYA